MKTCLHCHTPTVDPIVEKNHRYCSECGRELSETRWCKDCGTEIASSWRFCNQCGKEQNNVV